MGFIFKKKRKVKMKRCKKKENQNDEPCRKFENRIVLVHAYMNTKEKYKNTLFVSTYDCVHVLQRERDGLGSKTFLELHVQRNELLSIHRALL